MNALTLVPTRLTDVRAVLAGRLDDACTGVYWPEKGEAECRAHLDYKSLWSGPWPDAILAEVGVQCFSKVVCGVCDPDATVLAAGGLA